MDGAFFQPSRRSLSTRTHAQNACNVRITVLFSETFVNRIAGITTFDFMYITRFHSMAD